MPRLFFVLVALSAAHGCVKPRCDGVDVECAPVCTFASGVYDAAGLLTPFQPPACSLVHGAGACPLDGACPNATAQCQQLSLQAGMNASVTYTVRVTDLQCAWSCAGDACGQVPCALASSSSSSSDYQRKRHSSTYWVVVSSVGGGLLLLLVVACFVGSCREERAAFGAAAAQQRTARIRSRLMLASSI